MRLRAGDWVQVRRKDEILRTLDKSGRLEGLPFMPQMFSYCGQRFRVHSSAYKTCDTVSGHYRGLRLPDAVHLDIRCDGKAYGGCQAGCLIFWKNAWLKPVEGPLLPKRPLNDDLAMVDRPQRPDACSDRDVWEATTIGREGEETRYSCQATELLSYTAPLKWWDLRQYVEAYTSRNRTALQVCRGVFFLFYHYATLAFSDRWGRPARWMYNRFQAITGGIPFPRLKGKLPLGSRTPRRDLGLQPGELVRIRPYSEILATLDARLSNRGLAIDAELAPFCGKVFRVGTRIDRFVDERTGKMRFMKTPAVALDGVVCKSLYCGQRMFCPRSIHLWCREIWLERAFPHTQTTEAVAFADGTFAPDDQGALVKG
jgi:hypothetical protein